MAFIERQFEIQFAVGLGGSPVLVSFSDEVESWIDGCHMEDQPFTNIDEIAILKPGFYTGTCNFLGNTGGWNGSDYDDGDLSMTVSNIQPLPLPPQEEK